MDSQIRNKMSLTYLCIVTAEVVSRTALGAGRLWRVAFLGCRVVHSQRGVSRVFHAVVTVHFVVVIIVIVVDDVGVGVDVVGVDGWRGGRRWLILHCGVRVFVGSHHREVHLSVSVPEIIFFLSMLFLNFNYYLYKEFETLILMLTRKIRAV